MAPFRLSRAEMLFSAKLAGMVSVGFFAISSAVTLSFEWITVFRAVALFVTWFVLVAALIKMINPTRARPRPLAPHASPNLHPLPRCS